MRDGWIKLHRKILINPVVFKDPDHLAVWVYLLLEATHKEIKSNFDGEFIDLRPGQLITGRKQIYRQTGVQESKVERILKTLKNEQQIEQQSTSRGRLITILNWELYQETEQQDDQQVNNKRTTSEQPVNTNKNVKNDKNVKKEIGIESNDSICQTRLTEEVKSVVAEWNRSLPEYKIHKINPSSTRYKMLCARLRTYGLGEVLQVIQKRAESDFLSGQNKTGWTASFEWVMRPNNFIKIQEGTYVNRLSTQPPLRKKGDLDEYQNLYSQALREEELAHDKI